MNGELTGVWK